jgi:hypothetical protein
VSDVEIKNTDRDAIDKLDTLFAQTRGKAKAHKDWQASYQKTPDGAAVLSVFFFPPPEPITVKTTPELVAAIKEAQDVAIVAIPETPATDAQ